jgi:hypothetical protein
MTTYWGLFNLRSSAMDVTMGWQIVLHTCCFFCWGIPSALATSISGY